MLLQFYSCALYDESMDDTSDRGSYGSYDASEGVHEPVRPGAPANWCPPHLRPPGSRSRGPAARAHMAPSLAHDYLTETFFSLRHTLSGPLPLVTCSL